MTKRTKGSDSCTMVRRMLIRHMFLNLATSETDDARAEWVTRPCGVPLFGDDKAGGLCRGCKTGWTHPNNYPVCT